MPHISLAGSTAPLNIASNRQPFRFVSQGAKNWALVELGGLFSSGLGEVTDFCL